MNDRLLNNRAIINKLSELAERYPDLRFHQLLWNAGIVEAKAGKQGYLEIVDKYNEESAETWKQMINNRFCFPPSNES